MDQPPPLLWLEPGHVVASDERDLGECQQFYDRDVPQPRDLARDLFYSC
jgi:hypothetical protein